MGKIGLLKRSPTIEGLKKVGSDWIQTTVASDRDRSMTQLCQSVMELEVSFAMKLE